MENNPEYFSEIVYLRAIAILAVISIHVSVYFIEMDSINFLTLLYMSIDTFSQFAVPLFVCISGFVLYNKYQGSFSLKLFFKKRLMSVLPQYTVFSILIILSSYFMFMYRGRIWNFDIAKIIYMYLTGDWTPMGSFLMALWFFVLIIQLYIVYPIIERVFSKSVENHKTLGLLIFLLIVQILYPIFPIKNMFLIGKATMFLPYTFYFVLGMYVRFYYQNIKNSAIITQRYSYFLFIALVSATILGIGSYSIKYFRNDLNPQLIQIYTWIYGIITPLYYILIFTLCLFLALKFSEKNPNRFTKCLKIIGNYSFALYLIHFFISFILPSKLLPIIGFDMNNWLFYPIVFTLVLSLSLCSIYIINKFPYHEYVIGTLR